MKKVMEKINLYYSKILKKLRSSAIFKSQIDATSKVESGSNVYFSSMDKYSFCGYDCEIFYADIGPFVSIANGVIIGGGSHPMDWVGMSPVFYEGRDSVTKKFSEFCREDIKKTNISADVWIGRNALIRSGVKIGVGAVVGMGSVVTKDIPAYEIWAGNPARRISFRFNENLSKQLLLSKWWSLSDQTLHKVAKYIREPELFLQAVNNLKESS